MGAFVRGNGLEHIGSTAHCTLAAPIVIINIIISVMFSLDVGGWWCWIELPGVEKTVRSNISQPQCKHRNCGYNLQAVDSLKSSTLWIPQPQIGQNTLNFPTDARTWSVIANRCIQGHEHEADVIFCILYSEPSESYCHVEKLYR